MRLHRKRETTTIPVGCKCQIGHLLLCTCSLTEIVHSCIVPGCKKHSNKECKGKFYTFTINFGNQQTWYIEGATKKVYTIGYVVYCHFIDGVKKSNEDVPQIFPWQKSTSITPIKGSTVFIAIAPLRHLFVHL